MHRLSLRRHLFSVVIIGGAAVSPLIAWAQTTSWIVGVGDWGIGTNWSNGEPTADLDAEVPGGTPTVTQPGETCRNLTTGITTLGSTVRVESGGLGITERLHLASSVSGMMLQLGGVVSAGELLMGSPDGATYTMLNGTLTLGSAQIGSDDPSSGLFSTSVGNPVCTITGSLHIASGGSFVCGAGTLNVGTTPTDGTFVDGAFSVANTPTVSMTSFTLSESSFLHLAVGPFGVSPIVVSGTATLEGQLFLSDVLAPNGTYEVLRGSPLQGSFGTTTLPTDWSMRVEENSLLLTKGPVPVEPASWGRIKAHFDR